MKKRSLFSSRGLVAGLERVSLISQLRTRPPTEKPCAAPQPWLRAGQGLRTQHPSTSGVNRMTTKPMTWRSQPMLSVNLQGSDIHDWNDSRMRWAGTCKATLVMDLHQVNVLFKSHHPAQVPVITASLAIVLSLAF